MMEDIVLLETNRSLPKYKHAFKLIMSRSEFDMVIYDENNDSEFADDEKILLNNSNETKLTYNTKKVGRYKVELFVQETFEDTIPSMIEEDIYLKGDTSSLKEKEKSFIVGNNKPKAHIDIEKSKAADIVFIIYFFSTI